MPTLFADATDASTVVTKGNTGPSAEQRNRIADWVWLTHPVLGRFHLRLEGVEDSARHGIHIRLAPVRRMEGQLV